MTGECLRYGKGSRSASPCFLHAHTQVYFGDGIVFENMLRASAVWQITLFSRRTTHSWSGDIQIVGMGMSYSITRSGNLHSNALKSAPYPRRTPHPMVWQHVWEERAGATFTLEVGIH